jgi:hypothetical protein
MLMIRVVLEILALVCFFLSAIGIQAPRSGDLIAAGLGLWLIAWMWMPTT